MKLLRQEVEKIAHLARLSLTEAEIREFQEQLSAVLSYAETLNELDLTGIEPTHQAVASHNILRDDIVEPSLSLDDTLRNAHEHSQDQFFVQSVLPE